MYIFREDAHDSHRAILCMLFCPHIHTYATQDEVQCQKDDHAEVSKLGILTSEITWSKYSLLSYSDFEFVPITQGKKNARKDDNHDSHPFYVVAKTYFMW